MRRWAIAVVFLLSACAGSSGDGTNGEPSQNPLSGDPSDLTSTPQSDDVGKPDGKPGTEPGKPIPDKPVPGTHPVICGCYYAIDKDPGKPGPGKPPPGKPIPDKAVPEGEANLADANDDAATESTDGDKPAPKQRCKIILPGSGPKPPPGKPDIVLDGYFSCSSVGKPPPGKPPTGPGKPVPDKSS